MAGSWRRRVGLDEVPVRVEQPAFDGDLVRLPHGVQDHRQAHRDEHGVLQRDEHGEHEAGQQHRFLHGAGFPHRLKIGRLDGPVANQHEQAGQGRHGDVADQAGERDDHYRHHYAGDHQRHTRPGAGGLVQRRGRHGPAHRHPPEHPGDHVRGALPDEVTGNIWVAAVRVGEVSRNGRPLD